MSAVHTAERVTHTKAAFEEVDAVPRGLSEAVVVAPQNVRHVDSAREHKVLDKAAYGSIDQRGDNCGALAEAAAQSTRDVVLPAALPDAEVPRLRDALLAWIETEHHLAERDDVPAAGAGLS